MPTKKVFLRLALGALLIAGLFFVIRYLDSTHSNSQRALKPSQLDFTNSNQIQEDSSGKPIAPPEPESADVESEDLSVVQNLLSEPEQKLWVTFEEILKSKNDSDPRVGDLKNLSAEFRKALVAKYQSIKTEDRNERGFIVFLIAKDLQSASDLDFLQSVYQEQPCFSLESCSGGAADENPHTAGVNQTTLNYPQLAGLYQLEKQLEAKPELLKDPATRSGVLATLKQAEAFPVPVVHERAQKIRMKYKL